MCSESKESGKRKKKWRCYSALLSRILFYIYIYSWRKFWKNKSGHMTPLCVPFFFWFFFPARFSTLFFHTLFWMDCHWIRSDLTIFLLCCVTLVFFFFSYFFLIFCFPRSLRSFPLHLFFFFSLVLLYVCTDFIVRKLCLIEICIHVATRRCETLLFFFFLFVFFLVYFFCSGLSGLISTIDDW